MKKKLINTFDSLDSAPLRWATLTFGLVLSAATVLHGAFRAGGLNDDRGPLASLPGRVSSMVGLAADDLRFAGLDQHEPHEIMEALRLKPGASLVGFDADVARQSLERLPWVRQAVVSREYPNVLRINVTERKTIAIWQNGQNVDLIDETGANIGRSYYVGKTPYLLVTGEGANIKAAELINQISAIPDLKGRVTAAARLGGRRWNLYLDTGVKLALPEEGVVEALKTAWSLEQSQNVFSKGVALIDLRLKGQVGFQMAELDGERKPANRQ